MFHLVVPKTTQLSREWSSIASHKDNRSLLVFYYVRFCELLSTKSLQHHDVPFNVTIPAAIVATFAVAIAAVAAAAAAAAVAAAIAAAVAAAIAATIAAAIAAAVAVALLL